ncbi:hypothetical protein BHE74_00015936 [Ensete ventricosum]|nr:hypothetical protein GW17_00053740 [Ensete ventricosum]RWW76001.1 hypothetical protein BHE74_00015936 [Ensete ventricosum]RZS16415.1 hypothetical protein BHM03_00048402 [Ensete ventricosum]
MFMHKAKDTDKHEHFIKHLVYILTVTACQIELVQLCSGEGFYAANASMHGQKVMRHRNGGLNLSFV